MLYHDSRKKTPANPIPTASEKKYTEDHEWIELSGKTGNALHPKADAMRDRT